MIEVDLYIKGKNVFEYQTDVIPRVGDILIISHDNISGEFEVSKVKHRIFQDRKDKRVINYVIVEAL